MIFHYLRRLRRLLPVMLAVIVSGFGTVSADEANWLSEDESEAAAQQLGQLMVEAGFIDAEDPGISELAMRSVAKIEAWIANLGIAGIEAGRPALGDLGIKPAGNDLLDGIYAWNLCRVNLVQRHGERGSRGTLDRYRSAMGIPTVSLAINYLGKAAVAEGISQEELGQLLLAPETMKLIVAVESEPTVRQYTDERCGPAVDVLLGYLKQ